MLRKKTAAQLDREIKQALRGRAAPHPAPKKTALKRLHATKTVSFTDLIRDDDPSAMSVAEDFLLERGWKMREATGGLNARNFTIDMKPLYGPANQWKMVQVSVYKDLPGLTEAKYSVANGPVRVERKEKYAESVDAKKAAVATAWAIAKEIKPLSLDTDRRTIERVVDDALDAGLDNLSPEELF